MPPEPLAEEKAEIAKRLLETLRQAAVHVPVWQLTEANRWKLFRDTLFGHVPIRGALRPRDLPLDSACRRIAETTALIHAMDPYKDPHGVIYFRHWLMYFSLLNLAGSPADAPGSLDASQQLCCVILELVMAFTGSVPTGENVHATLAVHPFTQRLIGVLGLSQQEWQKLYVRYGRDATRAPRQVLLARFAAMVTAIPAPPQRADFKTAEEWRQRIAGSLDQPGFMNRRNEAKAALLSSLESKSFVSATLKPSAVQSYIASGRHHWNFRGASTWCSQTLGVARDLFADMTNGLLSSDSDAIVAYWLPASHSQSDLNDKLQKQLAHFWSLCNRGPDSLHGRFPRLAEWLLKELGDESRNSSGQSVLSLDQLPSFEVRCKEPWSLLEICVHRLPEEKKEKSAATIPAATETGSKCAHADGHPAVFTTYPPWLQPDGGGNPVGVAAIAWSLCGTTYRTHSHEGLCEALDEHDLALQPIHHGEWLKNLGMENSQLTHLKLDGDGVGARFRESPLADFPWLSVELARLMQSRLTLGVRGALDKHRRLFPLQQLQTLPVDIVYLGGDDLYACLPWDLVDSFLAAFGGTNEEITKSRWSSLSFTFIAARLRPITQILAGVDPGDYEARTLRLDAANQTAARLLTYGLRYVKDSFKNTSSLDVATLATLAGEKGMGVGPIPETNEIGCLRGRVVDVVRVEA